MDPIKKRIRERIKEDLQPLKTLNLLKPFKVVECKASPFAIEKNLPALHIVTGEEARVSKDTRGYTMEFGVDLRVIFEAQKDFEAIGDDLVAAVQRLIEPDLQLGGLANWIEYEGYTPYITEDMAGPCGMYVHYLVQYRRVSGQPEERY